MLPGGTSALETATGPLLAASVAVAEPVAVAASSAGATP